MNIQAALILIACVSWIAAIPAFVILITAVQFDLDTPETNKTLPRIVTGLVAIAIVSSVGAALMS
jgi:hypothetical protein